MEVTVERTPNPAAMKFTVGVPVGGPATFKEAEDSPAYAGAILGMGGVVSVFATADFVTVTADPSVDWDSLVPAITGILREAFG